MMQKIIYGGFMAGKRTYVLSVTGILTAVGAYLVGDIDLFSMMQAAFTLGGIFFLRKSNEIKNKSDKNRNTRR